MTAWRRRGRTEAGADPAGPEHVARGDGHPRGPGPDHRGSGRGRPAGPHTAPLVPWAAGAVVAVTLALIAPLEYAGGRALGLGPLHAAAVPATVEGFLLLAVLAGRLVPLALALTAGSMLLGALRTAADHGTHGLDRLALAQSVGLAVATVAVLAGTHQALLRTYTAALAARERADEAAAALAADGRAHELALAEVERARLADEQAADQRARAAERAHVLELQRMRAYAESERARLDADRAAADRAHQLALAERARPAAGAARAPRAAPDPMRDDVAQARRARAREQWTARERTDRPMTGLALAGLLGCSEGHARKVAAEWRGTVSTTDREAVSSR